MNYADIKRIDVANGPGVRVSLFVSGCTHKCKGCFNQETWDFNYGKPFTDETIDEIMEYLSHDYIKGLSLLGGDPFERSNQKALIPLVKKVKETFPEKTIWCYTGCLFDKDVVDFQLKEWDETKEFIKYLDFLVDGPFILEKKNVNLKFRGSENQRIIDLKKTFDKGEIIEWEGLKCER